MTKLNRALTLMAGAVATLVMMTGCATVPTVDSQTEQEAKKFSPPSEGMAGVYVYRDNSYFGSALYKDVYIDGICLGETARNVFFYTEVEGNKEHTVSTESEFSPNNLHFFAQPGELYFFRQYIRFGVFVGGAEIVQVHATEAKSVISSCDMAVPGTCSSTPPDPSELAGAQRSENAQQPTPSAL